MSIRADARRARAHVLLVVTAMIWGFAFVAQRVGAEHVTAYTFNGTRFLLGAASLVPLVYVVDRRLRTVDGASRWRAVLWPGVATGGVLFTGSALQQAGLGHTTAGNAGFITSLYIVIVPVLGVFLRRRATWMTWAGVVLAVVGLYLLSVTEGVSISYGDGLVLVCALFFAAHILLVGAFSGRGLDPLRFSVVQFVTSGVFSCAVALAVEEVPFAGTSQAVVPILYGGLLSVGVAYTLQVVAQADAEPTTAALLMSLEAVFGLVGGMVFLGEQMTVRGLTGCAVMLAGIVVAQLGEPDRA
ncbi:DMT family transporter [Austwickia chelonae]|uniref:EamA domain-containing protein n=1 Tax=Austwickia chelonae NBRC 105200 TaxID=1184607 RepID=K6VAL8_9MICO|nr:DMT family transporter [Austwickia chelonae]GAB79293.1 hypothetical protein AUCHE_22_00630 [Austwickia chelonae NBRC 105200]